MRAPRRWGIVGVPASELTANGDVLLTRKANTLYVHCFRPPAASGIVLRPLHVLPARATLLNTGQELDVRVDRGARMWHEPEYLRIRGLPVNGMQDTVMVAKLEFERPLGE